MVKTIENVHSGHRQRLRDKIANDDFEQVPDHEFLESILFFVVPRKNMNPLAHQMLKDFGTLQNIFLATKQQLMQTEGINENVAQFLITLPKLAKRLYASNETLKYYVTANDFAELFSPYFKDVNNEQVCIAFTRDNASLIALRVMELGTGHNVNFDINKIVEMAIKHNASNVILAHNHPFNNSQPSQQDIFNTFKLSILLELLDIKLLDHVIFGNDGITSTIHDVHDLKKEFKEKFNYFENTYSPDKKMNRRNQNNFSHIYEVEEYDEDYDIDAELKRIAREDFSKDLIEYNAEFHKNRVGINQDLIFSEEELKKLEVIGPSLKNKPTKSNSKTENLKKSEKINDNNNLNVDIVDTPLDSDKNLNNNDIKIEKNEKASISLKQENETNISNITREQELLNRLKQISKRHSKKRGDS